MADSNETHVVEIPRDSQTHQQNPNFEEIQHHPLTEISESPGHLLLLNLFQREEDHFSRRIGLEETRLDNLKRDAFHLSSLFFSFHGLFFTLLFTSSIAQSGRRACKKWWVPCFLSLLTSVVLISSIQMKICGYWKVLRSLNRETSERRGIARLVMELRTKGKSFDLSKELMVGGGRRMLKSSSVEIEWRPLRFLKQNTVTICLVGFSCLVVPACKFVLCSSESDDP